MKIQKREKEPVEPDYQVKVDNKKVTMNNYEQKINIDQNINMQKMSDYEEAFRKLYEATGVTDVNEIIQKFTTQEETSKSLLDLKFEYHSKIENLN